MTTRERRGGVRRVCDCVREAILLDGLVWR